LRTATKWLIWAPSHVLWQPWTLLCNWELALSRFPFYPSYLLYGSRSQMQVQELWKGMCISAFAIVKPCVAIDRRLVRDRQIFVVEESTIVRGEIMRNQQLYFNGTIIMWHFSLILYLGLPTV
jgi:hypothetical protein